METTAVGVALMRALEADVPVGQRLLDDPVSGRLLAGWPGLVARHRPARVTLGRLAEVAMPGMRGTAVCRTRVVDDWCRAALAAGAAQAVIVGAGLDTRPYRLAELAGVPVWEVDLPRTQAIKRAALARALGTPPANVRYLAADLNAGPPGALLADAGFDPGVPTLVLFEAVAQYLPESSVGPVLAWAGSLAPGSRLVFTYLPRRVIEQRARGARRYGWLSAFDPARLAAVLAGHGLVLGDDLGAADYRGRYPELAGRRLSLREIERVAVAEVKPAST
ncbi:methyltransferase (TIGR00027 family) [Asanoa ferruginea]|uniref:S-adenosyl-L-methionine-dependent methyltransferase n=1 Tax=Asanoa ferruginea TaxID=53367 RepID=A0A3D9ZNP9_9ACTN|nr:methyltransferase (TIGR00027 family) [Asanoa ferruginea]